MNRTLLIVVLVAIVALAGCGAIGYFVVLPNLPASAPAALSVQIEGPAAIRAGQEATYTAKPLGGKGPYDFDWSWDGGDESGPSTVKIKFAESGTKAVEVTAYDANGASASKTFTVTVRAATSQTKAPEPTKAPAPTSVPTASSYPTRAPITGVQWGPAGQAPQTLDGVMYVLHIPTHMRPYITPQYCVPNNPAITCGWTVGTQYSQDTGIRLTADVGPGLCVDYDPGVTLGSNSNTFESGWPVVIEPKWSRGLTKVNWQLDSLKITVWWTECSKTR